jgi:hypothetical protein
MNDVIFINQYLDKNLKVNAVGLQQYSRKSLTEKLANTISKFNGKTKG